MSDGSKFIPFEQLVDLAEERLDPATQAALLAQANAGDQMALRWLRRVLTLMQRDASFDAPPEVVARAIRLRQPASSPRRIGAILRFDSRTQAAFGLRSGFMATQQLLYNADERDIDLRIAPAAQLWTVAGQVLGPEEPGTVRLAGNESSVDGALTELAEFVLPPVPGGIYTLTLSFASVEIRINDLQVGA